MTANRHLQEVVFAAHLAVPLTLSIDRLYEWKRLFALGDVREEAHAVLPPVNVPSPGAPAQVMFQFGPANAELPRLIIENPEDRSVFIIQADRFGFGWRRGEPVGPEVDYPGFEILLPRWKAALSAFADWISGGGEPFAIRIVELDYANAFPLSPDQGRRRLRDVLRFVDPDARPVNSFQLSWGEILDEGGVVTAQAGLGSAPPGQRVLAMNYQGMLAPIPHDAAPATTVDQVVSATERLHARIVDMHQAAVSSEN